MQASVAPKYPVMGEGLAGIDIIGQDRHDFFAIGAAWAARRGALAGQFRARRHFMARRGLFAAYDAPCCRRLGIFLEPMIGGRFPGTRALLSPPFELFTRKMRPHFAPGHDFSARRRDDGIGPPRQVA